MPRDLSRSRSRSPSYRRKRSPSPVALWGGIAGGAEGTGVGLHIHHIRGQIEEYDSPSKLLEDESSGFAQLVAEYSMRSKTSFEK